MNPWIAVASILIAIASSARPALAILQIPLVVASIAVLRDPSSAALCLALSLSPSLTHLAKLYRASRSLRQVATTLLPLTMVLVATLATAWVLTTVSSYLEACGTNVYAPLALSALLILTTVARAAADGFPQLPASLEVAGYTIAAVITLLTIPTKGVTPFALAIASIIARATLGKKLRVEIATIPPIAMLTTALILYVAR